MKKNKIIWMDGTTEKDIPGKLLSDNPNFFGDCITTGVTYSYADQLPTGIGDSDNDVADYRGRRLIDGDILCRFGKPIVETESGNLSVVFDFGANYLFTELTCYMRSQLNYAKWEVSDDNILFTKAYSESLNQDSDLYRMRASTPVAGRYVRLTLTDTNKLQIIQVWVWGDAKETSDIKDEFDINRFAVANSVSLESLMGITNTAFSDVEGFLWSQKVRKQYPEMHTVWSEMPAYGSLASNPILPSLEQIGKISPGTVFRDGVRTVCLALTNTNTDSAVNIRVEVNNVSPLRTELYAFGHIETRWYGIIPGPLLNEEHCIARPLLYRYLKNAPVIADFPTLHLPAGGSCLLWLKIYGDNAEPGVYSVILRADESTVEIKTTVLPLSLGAPKSAILTYGYRTEMWPFCWEDRNERDVEYRNEIGANVYRGLPLPGTVNAEAMRTNPTVQIMAGGLGEYGWRLFCNQVAPEEMSSLQAQEKLRMSMQDTIDQAEKLGLGYNQWYLELPDEPGAHNAEAVGIAVRFIKENFPKVRIYCNPAFWVGFENGGVADDDTVCSCLKDWYPLIDLSLPLMMLLWNRPKAYKYFSQKREFNGQYQVSSQHMRSDNPELLNLGRNAAWESLSRNMNFWGFFAYHEPALDSWNETAEKDKNTYGTINYQCVYSGEFGPIPTRASELVREGYHDFCIMQLLHEVNPGLCAEIKQEYLNGCHNYEKLIKKAVDYLAHL